MRDENGNLINDLTGTRSGRLVAKQYLYTIPHKGAVWECICDCGNSTTVLSTLFKSGKIKSCGCLATELFKENMKKNAPDDLCGKRFGMLTVLKRAPNRKRQVRWECKCDCGTIKIICGTHLKSKKITSCGCTKGSRISEKLRNPIPEIRKEDSLYYFNVGDTRVLFDEEDSDIVVSHSWFFNAHGYVSTKKHGEKAQYLHRLVFGRIRNIDGYVVDHINGNPNDNRKCNLRTATVQQNICNSCLRKDNTSGYKGVHMARSGRWVAGITSKKKQYYLGTYDTIDEAIEARKLAENLLHGEFVREEKYLHNRIVE